MRQREKVHTKYNRRHKKRSGRDPKFYTGELFLETFPKLKGSFKSSFD